MLIQFDLTGNHVAELLSVLLLASEIGNHVPKIPIEVADPFFVIVTSIDLSERFLEKCRSQPFIPVVVVLPQGDKQQLVIIQCFHICSFLSKTSAYRVGIFISWCLSCLFVGDCGKAWRKKIPQRSEDDFLSANPAPERGRLAQSARQTAIFTARNEKADLRCTVLKSAFRSLSSFMLFRYVSAIRGTAAMLRQTICPVFRDRADLLRYLFFHQHNAG